MKLFEPYIPQILAIFGKARQTEKSNKTSDLELDKNDQEVSLHVDGLKNTADIMKDAATGSPRASDEHWDEL